MKRMEIAITPVVRTLGAAGLLFCASLAGIARAPV